MSNNYPWNLDSNYIAHHGIKGQKWGTKNGPPYPLDDETNRKVRMGKFHSKQETGGDAKYTEKNSTLIANQAAVENLKSLAKKTKSYSIEEDIDAVNPQDKPGQRHGIGRVFNCQNSALALDMRLKGYDVEARRRSDGSNVGDIASYYKNAKLSNFKTDIDMDALDALAQKRLKASDKDYPRIAKEYHDLYAKIHNETYDKFCDELRSQGNGSRGIIVVGWELFYDEPRKTTDFFHAYNYEVKNNKLIFYDSQPTTPVAKDRSKMKTERVMKNSKIALAVDPRELNYMRTNDLEPSEKITECVVSKNKVK